MERIRVTKEVTKRILVVVVHTGFTHLSYIISKTQIMQRNIKFTFMSINIMSLFRILFGCIPSPQVIPIWRTRYLLLVFLCLHQDFFASITVKLTRKSPQTDLKLALLCLPYRLIKLLLNPFNREVLSKSCRNCLKEFNRREYFLQLSLCVKRFNR
jgi:hypothetical protein